MSRATETIHVRGVDRATLVASITEHMAKLGFVQVSDDERHEALRADPQPRRIALRRDGAWFSFADDDGFTNAGGGGLDRWGAHLSLSLDCAVLTIWTWDGEASVGAKRWEHGRVARALELLTEAYWGEDGRPYAPAAVLEPWLAPASRAAMLERGFKLEHPSGRDAVVRVESDDEDEVDDPFVSESNSVAAIGAAVGMQRPGVHPWEPEEADEEFLFRRNGRG